MNRGRFELGSFTVLLVACLAIGLAAPASAFRFVTTCDSQGPDSANPDPGTAFNYVVGHINAIYPRPDFWIFGGDAYYSAIDSADAMVRWNTWKAKISDIEDIPLYLAIGNHDANNYGHFYGSWYGDGAGPFKASWPGLPQNGPTGYKGTAYSFRFGNSMFCVVNTNIYNAASYSATFKVDATQRSWLAAVLDTTTAVHRFVVGHCEAYPPNNSSSSSLEWNVSDRNAFWSVMAAHDVEAYICGHIHLWNRDYFVASGHGNPPADTTTRQVVCGGAGGSLVSGYGGYFYHFVVWDIDGPSVVARVVDSYGNLRDSIKYTVPSGIAELPSEALPEKVAIRNIRLVGGQLRWDGYRGPARVDVYAITGQRVWRGHTQGVSVSWRQRPQAGAGKASSGLYLVRVCPDDNSPAEVGRVLVVR